MSQLVSNFQLDLMLRIILASVLGLCIGFERKTHNRFAGVKTHMIVCFSSALVMVVSKYAFDDTIRYDAARLAAQMISGVGFIGAGIILKHEDMVVKGLTTAAGILGTCGVGLAIGSGMYLIGTFAAALYIVLSKITNRYDIFHQSDLIQYTLTVHSTDVNTIIAEICHDRRVTSYQVNIKQEDHLTCLKMLCAFDSKRDEEDWENNLLSRYEISELGKYSASK